MARPCVGLLAALIQSVWLGCGLGYWLPFAGKGRSDRGMNLLTNVHLMTEKVGGVLRDSLWRCAKYTAFFNV